MKNKRNWMAVFVIGILVLTAYRVPSVMADIEDDRLKNITKKYEIEEIKLNSAEVDYRETLALFGNLLSGQVFSKESKEVNESQRDYMMVKQAVEKFLGIFDVEFEFTSFYVNYIVMVNLDFDKVYPLFCVSATGKSNEQYYFWLNVMDGMVIAFDMPNMLEFDVDVSNMADYYGFTVVSIWDMDLVDKTNDNRIISVCFVDNKTGEEIYVPCSVMGERISFNLDSKYVQVGEVTSQSQTAD